MKDGPPLPIALAVGASKDDRIEYPYKRKEWNMGDRVATGPLAAFVFPGLQRLSPGSVLADMGGGDGFIVRNAPEHTNRQYQIVSFDQSPEGIERQREVLNGGPDRAEVADITAINLREALGGREADAAIASRVLHALPDDAQVEVTKRVAESLTPGGIFYVSALSDSDWKPQEAARLGMGGAGRYVDYFDIMRLEETGRDRSKPWNAFAFPPDRFQELAEAAGLEVVPLAELVPQNGNGNGHLPAINGDGASLPAELVTEHGLRIVSPTVAEFTEPTSFPHLEKDHPDVTYYFAAMRKPEATRGYAGPVEIWHR